MPIQVIESDRLYRKIARQLAGLIDAGELPPGKRLPAERVLAQQLGVSRPSVREALIALEIEGRVEVRVGAGVFVAAPQPPQAALPDAGEGEGEGPFELIRARWLIEGETAAAAAREATDAEIAEIRAAVDHLRARGVAGPEAEDPDRTFHTAIARATHNGPLAAVVAMLWDQGRGAVWHRMEAHFQTPALRAATLRDHRAVAEAIARRQPAAARAAMRRHLSRVDQEFTRGFALLKRSRARPEPKRRAAP